MTKTQAYTGVLTVLQCGDCGVTFGMTEEYIAERKRDHRTWHCPNGHRRYYPGKTDEEREIERLRSSNEALAHERRRLKERQDSLPGDVRDAQERARVYSNRALRGAFWRGFDDRNCGREVSCCPYPTNRFGFRAAWLDGFGAEETEAAR